MSDLESGELEGCSVDLLERWSGSLNANLVLDLRISGPRPLTDRRHAAIQNWLAETLRGAGWLVDVEPSFNHYGDRGRIDIFAFHPGRGILLVVEIKTEVRDVQDLIGRLDVKQRVARQLATDRGWEVAAIVPAIVLRKDRTIRRRIAEHPALFARSACDLVLPGRGCAPRAPRFRPEFCCSGRSIADVANHRSQR